ncbi:hypothetical protein Q3G72_031856 [Acer saccharum]|nr:hypothetical protein Q3G72_031856 [Acer saccharum]
MRFNGSPKIEIWKFLDLHRFNKLRNQNGFPDLETLVEPEILRFMAYEPILLLGSHRFAGVDMLIRVKALVAYFQKFVDEQSKKEIKGILRVYDRTLLVADPRRCEPKKFGGGGASARFQRSCH